MGHASATFAPDGPSARTAAGPGAGPSSLCARLRLATRDEHAAVERQLRLPEGVATPDRYRALLCGFLAVHRPLARAILALPGWEATGIDPRPRLRVAELEADLRALGVDPCGPPGPEDGPAPVGSVAEALGALYVLEGSTLGGSVIARALRDRLGEGIAGATAFLAGRGDRTGPMWRRFRDALDAYGLAHPERAEAVVAGARAAFAAHRRHLPPSGSPS